tara:strand:- start:226 stop:579 length:354 start_codon:yes stop_codon:yes gene_type:complete
MLFNHPVIAQEKFSSYEKVCFEKGELNKILNVYGRMVSVGEWRDYGISIFRDYAIFSIYKGYGESAMYTIEKRPKSIKRNGKFSVVGVDGAILKRANDLEIILSIFSRKLIKLYKTS